MDCPADSKRAKLPKSNMILKYSAGLAALVCLNALAQSPPIAFTGAKVIPVDGAEIENGVVVVENGKILAVGPAASVAIPANAQRIDVRGKVIAPGLVDSHSHIGQPEGADASSPFQPDVRVLDSVNPRAASIKRARAGGITTVNVMPGSGHLLSGQTLYLKLREARVIDDLLIKLPDGSSAGGIKMANGTNSRRNTPFPGTRAKSAAIVRDQFIKAQDYRAKVQAAIEALDYSPTRSPGGNATRRHGFVGVLVPYFDEPSSYQRLRGIVRAVQLHGLEIVLYNVDAPDRARSRLLEVPRHQLDGLIIISLPLRSDEGDRLAKAPFPIVLVAGTFMPASALPPDFDLRDEMDAGADPEGGEDVLLTGGSGVIGPDGSWIAGPVIGEECVVYADLELDQVAREQFALDTVGHYSRPDIFTLTVDTRKKPQVNWMRERDFAPARPLGAEDILE